MFVRFDKNRDNRISIDEFRVLRGGRMASKSRDVMPQGSQSLMKAGQIWDQTQGHLSHLQSTVVVEPGDHGRVVLWVEGHLRAAEA